MIIFASYKSDDFLLMLPILGSSSDEQNEPTSAVYWSDFDTTSCKHFSDLNFFYHCYGKEKENSMPKIYSISGSRIHYWYLSRIMISFEHMNTAKNYAYFHFIFEAHLLNYFQIIFNLACLSEDTLVIKR